MGKFSLGQAFCTEITFFHNTLGAGGEVGIGLFDEGTGIPEVETSGTIGAGSHAEPAADAAMVVHEHDAVFAFEGGLGRAGLGAGGFLAMVTGNQEGEIMEFFRQEFIFLVRECIFKMLVPDPFDFLLGVHRTLSLNFQGEVGYVVGLMAGFFNGFGNVFIDLVDINDHAPPVAGKRFFIFGLHRIAGLFCQAHYRRSTQADGSNTCYFQKASSAFFHHSISLGFVWHSQQ